MRVTNSPSSLTAPRGSLAISPSCAGQGPSAQLCAGCWWALQAKAQAPRFPLLSSWGKIRVLGSAARRYKAFLTQLPQLPFHLQPTAQLGSGQSAAPAPLPHSQQAKGQEKLCVSI